MMIFMLVLHIFTWLFFYLQRCVRNASTDCYLSLIGLISLELHFTQITLESASLAK